jgi:anti-sigma regulatory factor (Ser/Thr protein kinase)
LLSERQDDETLIEYLMAQLAEFTGPDWEQEDDVTMVILQHCLPESASNRNEATGATNPWRTLTEFSLSSALGNEREAMRQVGRAVQELTLSDSQQERLKTAVAEATMNAIEHGNKNRPELPVFIQVLASPKAVSVRITDRGGGRPIPEPEAPDLEAKLAGLQTPRGWGLFLIKNLMDEMHVSSDETHHTVELILYLEAEKNVSQTT